MSTKLTAAGRREAKIEKIVENYEWRISAQANTMATLQKRLAAAEDETARIDAQRLEAEGRAAKAEAEAKFAHGNVAQVDADMRHVQDRLTFAEGFIAAFDSAGTYHGAVENRFGRGGMPF